MSHPVLARFDVTILRNKSTSDAAQVPASGATIKFYRQGATSQQYVEIRTFEERVPVDVYDTGALIVGDTIQIDNAGPQLAVDDILSNTRVLLSNYNGPDAFVNVGSRLVPIILQPQVYADPVGATTGSTQLTTNASGRAGGYLRESRFDYGVSGGGITIPRLYVDAAGSGVPSLASANALDFPSIQAAIDWLPSGGGVVYVPGAYEVTETIVIPKDKAVHLIGDGPGRSVIHCANPSQDILWVKGSYSTIENLTIEGPGIGGSGRGIVLGLLASDNPTDVLRRVSVIGCEVTHTANWALKFIDLCGTSREGGW